MVVTCIHFFGFDSGYYRLKLQNMQFYHNEVLMFRVFVFDATPSVPHVFFFMALVTAVLRAVLKFSLVLLFRDFVSNTTSIYNIYIYSQEHWGASYCAY